MMTQVEAPKKNDFGRIYAALEEAEGVFRRVAELADDLVGPAHGAEPSGRNEAKGDLGSIGLLSKLADQILASSEQAHNNIVRIRSATDR